ncbi:MAG: hypothetical protein HRO68_09905 [Nitrosopumilus sp.]|nr:hypothetical protein [Nitrosopumilus sp.]
MKPVWIILFTLFLIGCEQQEWLIIDIPDSATNQYSGYPLSDYSKQTSYLQILPYPDDSALKAVESKLIGEWRSCDYGGDDWQNFEDVSSGTPKHIHQRIQTWKKNGNHLVFAALKYESSSCKCCECEPDNDKQSVVVIEQQIPWWQFWGNIDELCNG